MDFDQLQNIENYLHRGEYPSGIEKKDKANFRRKCRNNYKFEKGTLYYKKCTVKEVELIPGASEWKVCIRSEKEKTRVLESCHGDQEKKDTEKKGEAGGHLGRDKTLAKICSRYYWKAMVDEIREYVRKCPQCQKNNTNFIKTNAKLHPIPVQPKVWCQVGIDLIGPLPTTSKGNKYVVTLVD